MNRPLLLAVSLVAISPFARTAEVGANWEKHCASCHGKDGKGATKAGRMAGAKDLTDAAYQKSFTDEKAFSAVKDGIKDNKGKDRMKPYADKMTDDEIKALIVYVRKLGG